MNWRIKMSELLELIETSLVERGAVIWWLGGPSWVMKTPEALLYVDLFTGPAPKETLTPLTKNYIDLIMPQTISKADLVLSTHEHIDHCHRESLLSIYQNTQAIFVGGMSSAKSFRSWGFKEKRIIELQPGQSYRQFGVLINALPNRDCVDPGAISYLIRTGDISVFDGGDSLYFDGFKGIGQRYQIDIALLNFFKNPPESNMILSMTPPEVAQAARDLQVKVLIPMHWNLWTELQDDPQKIREFLKNSSVRLEILSIGQAFKFVKQ
jgi:L-ascorbate 6-phosphate lactonase